MIQWKKGMLQDNDVLIQVRNVPEVGRQRLEICHFFLLRFDLIGTTDKIFDTKQDMYDLFVDKQQLRCHNEYYNKITKLNSADSARFSRLKKYR